MRNRGFLALMGGAGACVVALGQGCSSTPATSGAGGEGGDLGGSSTGGKASGGASTGGNSTGGTQTGGTNTGGSNDGGMGGMGGLVCTGETWFDDTSDSCESCASVSDHVLVCADFVDEVDDGTAKNPKTKWNEATQIFTVQIANGLPSPTSAVFKYEWYCTNVDCAIEEPGEVTGEIHGDTITFDFGDLADEVNQIGGTTLSITDDCGVETDVDHLWFADYNLAETFYVDCE